MFGRQQALPQQNQIFQPPAIPGQFGGANYPSGFGQGQVRYMPMMGGPGNFPMSPRLGHGMNGYPSSGGAGMPMPQGMLGTNPGWGATPFNAGGQGYTAPGYPPRGFGQQPFQQPMMPAQGYPSQGYGGQMPVQQPAWEAPKGGIKGFISNLMNKKKQ